MKKLKFTYRMKVEFDLPVREHYFALRCVPASNEAQKIEITNRYVYPADSLNIVRDGFGNLKYVGECFDFHNEIECAVSGIAVVDGMKVQKEELHPMYKYPSFYTQPSAKMRTLIEELSLDNESSYEIGVKLMNLLYSRMKYIPGSTDIHTTAAQAFEKGEGVCQDYAHIFISLCRLAGIPARYVNGLMIGEGYTHAWVEIYTDGGWYGLDPTNNLHVDDYYIKLAHGRDYGDCVLDKGRFLGSGLQKQKIYVNVEEI